MGIGVAPSACRLVLVMSEYDTLTSQDWKAWIAELGEMEHGGLRFVDDGRLWAWHPPTWDGPSIVRTMATNTVPR